MTADRHKYAGEDMRRAGVLRIHKLRKATEAADELVIDMLTDLRHYCDSEMLDFGKLDRVAYKHYCEEK